MAPQLPQSGREWLGRFARTLHMAHVDIDLGSEDAVVMLTRQGAEAVTVSDESGATILFGSNEPTSSAVLEELAHALQARKGRFSDKNIQEMRCLREIEAKECLVARRAALGITAEEDAVTRRHLAEERAILESLR